MTTIRIENLRLAGIPCQADVAIIDKDNVSIVGLFDRHGRRAAWLENKMTPVIECSLENQAMEELEIMGQLEREDAALENWLWDNY